MAYIIILIFGVMCGGALTALWLRGRPENGVKLNENPYESEDETVHDMGRMSGERLKSIIRKLDDLATFNGNSANFSMNALNLIMVYDEAANRMRIMAPIAKQEGIPEALFMRMLQANYNTVLDVRYAVADGHIWALFLHPLSTLTEGDFISAAAQTAAAADNFGHSYSSGRMMFRGGDHTEN